MQEWSKLNLQKIFLKYEPILQQKYRPSIFKQKKLKFQCVYSPALPQIIFFEQVCPCKNSLIECQRLKSILIDNKILRCEKLYESVKLQLIKKNQNAVRKIFRQQINPVLKPHFVNLSKILIIKQPQPLIRILQHAKSQYLTFWIYGLFCAKWPSKVNFFQNIGTLIKKHNLDLNFDIRDYQNNLQDPKDQFLVAYDKKLSNIYKGSHEYITLLRLVCEQKVEMMVEKLTVCMLIKGRQRSQKQAINAALQL